jgi:hypothetical protein
MVIYRFLIKTSTLFTVNEVEVNFFRTVLAFFGIVATPLNYELMPRQFVICLISTLFVEANGTHDIRQQNWEFHVFTGFRRMGLLAGRRAC